MAERPLAVGCQLGAPQAHGAECQSSVQPELWLASCTDEAGLHVRLGAWGLSHGGHGQGLVPGPRAAGSHRNRPHLCCPQCWHAGQITSMSQTE